MKNPRRFKISLKPDKVMGRYEGMNRQAAKELGFHPLPRKREIFVNSRYSPTWRRVIKRHEIIESRSMSKGLSYKSAHKIANRYEK